MTVQFVHVVPIYLRYLGRAEAGAEASSGRVQVEDASSTTGPFGVSRLKYRKQYFPALSGGS
jgi:hypothetical protein